MLYNDPDFKKCLEKSCESNFVNVEAVKKCIGGLYHIIDDPEFTFRKKVISANISALQYSLYEWK